MKNAERAERIRRSIKEGKCAWCGRPIPGWPGRKGMGDSKRGRFCSPFCLGNMHGSEFIERHRKRLKASEN